MPGMPQAFDEPMVLFDQIARVLDLPQFHVLIPADAQKDDVSLKMTPFERVLLSHL